MQRRYNEKIGKSLITLSLISMLMLSTVLIITPLILANGQAGTTLTADVTATAYWTRTFGWTIDKSVDPDYWVFYPGDSGTSTYTITLTKDSGTEEAWVEGQVCVTNGGAVATENLVIVVKLYNGYPPPNDYLTEATVDVSDHPILAPGETYCYSYRANIPITGGTYPQPHAGGTYKVTAVVTITNHSGHLGEPFGPSPSATTTLPSSPTLINDTVRVDDTNGSSWTFSASGSVTYDKTFVYCQEGEHKNAATIRETGQSDDATVTVVCVITPQSVISGVKFYDADVDGELDPVEVRLSGWTIELYKWNEGTENWDLVDSKETDYDGAFSFIVTEAGNYKLCEVLPTPPPTWIQTAPESGCYKFTVSLGSDNDDMNFGNVKLGCYGGGRTIGFWSNKNGQAKMNDGGTMSPELALMVSLNLKDKSGSDFNPTSYAAFKSWLLKADATNMAYMLSAQLAAMALNVEAGFVNQNAIVYAGPTLGFMTISELMDAANTELGLHGYTPAGSEYRAYQEALKNALDWANNNLNFVCPSP